MKLRTMGSTSAGAQTLQCAGIKRSGVAVLYRGQLVYQPGPGDGSRRRVQGDAGPGDSLAAYVGCETVLEGQPERKLHRPRSTLLVL